MTLSLFPRLRAPFFAALLVWLPFTVAAQLPSTMTPRPTKGFDFGWGSPLSSAPSVLRWRFGIDLGDFDGTMEQSLGQAATVPVANYVGSGVQRVSLQIPRPLGPRLFAGELRAVERMNVALVGYRVPTVPADETALRELFDFAQRMKIEALIFDGIPAQTALLDMLSQRYGIGVALCGPYEALVKVIAQAGPRIGACLNTARLAQAQIKADRAVADLKDRILIVELQDWAGAAADDADKLDLLKTLYVRGIKPVLFVLKQAATADLRRVTQDLSPLLSPIMADCAAQRSRRVDQGRNDDTTEQKAAREAYAAKYTAGNTITWDPATPDRRVAIDAALPKKAMVEPRKPRKLLVLDLNMGYPGHASIPTHNYGLKQLGIVTGAYEAVFDNNLDNLKYPKVKEFDAIFLNNTVGLIFSDPLVREGLLRFVREGGGLGGIHGASHASIDWPQFAELIGAAASAHLEPTETVWLKLDDPKSPLNAGFGGKQFLFQDEYYHFTQPPYSRDSLHVLLSVDVDRTDMAQMPSLAPFSIGREDSDYAVSWIKEYGRGRVFYTTLGHNPTLFTTPEIAQHMLAALQFILGDLDADASPSSRMSKR